MGERYLCFFVIILFCCNFVFSANSNSLDLNIEVKNPSFNLRSGQIIEFDLDKDNINDSSMELVVLTDKNAGILVSNLDYGKGEDFVLSVGEEKGLDIDKDGILDVYVVLTGIFDGEAFIEFQNAESGDVLFSPGKESSFFEMYWFYFLGFFVLVVFLIIVFFKIRS